MAVLVCGLHMAVLGIAFDIREMEPFSREMNPGNVDGVYGPRKGTSWLETCWWGEGRLVA